MKFPLKKFVRGIGCLLVLILLGTDQAAAQAAFQAGAGDGYAMDEVMVPVGIEGCGGVEAWSLFPNPVQVGGKIELRKIDQCDPQIQDDFEWIAYDLQGIEVMKSHSQGTKLLLPVMPPGLYLIEIRESGSTGKESPRVLRSKIIIRE